MELNLNASGFERASELATWIANNPERVEALRDTPELIEKKRRIITSFYETGRIDGLYFGRASNSKRNHVKEYIKSCLYRNRIKDESLIDDCYNELFIHLQKMPASKFCAMYDLAPAKVLATALHIISLKCFAVDPRYGNPRHSLIQSIRYASLNDDNVEIDRTEDYRDRDLSSRGQEVDGGDPYITNVILTSHHDDPDDFSADYGFTPEAIIELLTPGERSIFYDIIGKQPRGKTPAAKIEARAKLFDRLREIKAALVNG